MTDLQAGKGQTAQPGKSAAALKRGHEVVDQAADRVLAGPEAGKVIRDTLSGSGQYVRVLILRETARLLGTLRAERTAAGLRA